MKIEHCFRKHFLAGYVEQLFCSIQVLQKVVKYAQSNSKILSPNNETNSLSLKYATKMTVFHFFFLLGFSFTDTDDLHDNRGKRGNHLLFHSTTSTRARTYRNLLCKMTITCF